MDKLFGFPAMGSEVSNGAFGVKVLPGAKGAGLVCARKGAAPVAVGPRWFSLKS